MEPKNVIAAVVIGLLVLAVGMGLGIFYQSQATPSAGSGQATPQIIKGLSSRVIPSISAHGVVTKIDGKNLTLTQETDTMVISIREDAKIYSFTANSGAAQPVSKAINFEEIKVGDNTSINLKILPTGQMEGISVIILPIV